MCKCQVSLGWVRFDYGQVRSGYGSRQLRGHTEKRGSEERKRKYEVIIKEKEEERTERRR